MGKGGWGKRWKGKGIETGNEKWRKGKEREGEEEWKREEGEREGKE